MNFPGINVIMEIIRFHSDMYECYFYRGLSKNLNDPEKEKEPDAPVECILKNRDRIT